MTRAAGTDVTLKLSAGEKFLYTRALDKGVEAVRFASQQDPAYNGDYADDLALLAQQIRALQPRGSQNGQ